VIANVSVLFVVLGFVLALAGLVLSAARWEVCRDAQHTRLGTRYRKPLAVAR
jgi:hypothetical protein